MGRPTTKQQLLSVAEAQFAKLWQTIDDMPAEYKQVAFNFLPSPSKKRSPLAARQKHS